MADRHLRLAFETPDAFRVEYERNIHRGGAFIPTQERFDLREHVQVELDLAFCDQCILLTAEVVHQDASGVAVEFLEPAPELRERLQGFVERRTAPRSVARVPVRVKAPTGSDLEGRMRNVSRSGALISVEGSALPVGREVRLALIDPSTGEPVEVEGRVIRHLEGEGTVPAVAVRFEPASEREPEVVRVIEEIRETDERLQREGIRGPIDEVGAASLIQMFAGFATRGTLTLIHEVEEATIVFDEGQLLYAEVGSVTGIKALTRTLSWESGEFEFRAHVDPLPEGEKPQPLEAALLEAARRLDEEKRLPLPPLSPGACLSVDRTRLAEARDLSQTEEAVLDLAMAGFSVRRILDVIPEDDVEIQAAISSLFEKGIVTPIAEE